MKLHTFVSIAQSGRLRALRALSGLAPDLYRATFLATAARCGLLARLAAGPATLTEIGAALGIDPRDQDGLDAWLVVGESIRELDQTDGRWRLRGHLARALAAPENDDLLAVVEECVDLHHRLVTETPQRLRDRRRFSLSDQDGLVIARSSRLLEPLVREAIDAALPTDGQRRLLEIGCGSGTYIHYSLSRNPRLEVVGLELQPEVAAQARRNLAAWGRDAQVAVQAVDARHFRTTAPFDLVTLHNNIYYFAPSERVDLFRHLRGLLRSGGTLLITTGCAGGSPAMSVLSLWGAVTEGCGPLPRPAELVEQLGAAGFGAVRARNLAAPVDAFYAFTAR